MRLDSSRIKGVLRFRDEVTILYRDLPPGLIALVGENGEGKSTALEAPLATAFREFPSRCAPDKFYEYVHGTDAFLETTFELEGQGLYRARLNLDGPHRKAEGVVAQVQADGQEVFLNDGKVTTFDAVIQKLLPPKALLLASVFAAQTRKGSFGELDRRDRRILFASLLGLDHMQERAERAKQAATLVQQTIEQRVLARDLMARDVTPERERELGAQADSIARHLREQEQRQMALKADLDGIEVVLANLQDAVARHATARVQVGRLAADLAARTAERHQTIAALRAVETDLARDRLAEVEDLKRALTIIEQRISNTRAHEDELAQIDATATAVLTDADERIANNRKRLAEEDAIRAAVEAIQGLEAAVRDLRAGADGLTRGIDSARTRERVLSDSLAIIAQAERDLARVNADTAVLDTVPFGGRCADAGCTFLTNVLAAKAKAPALEHAAASKATAEAELTTVRGKMHDATAALALIQERIHAHENELTAQKRVADRLPDVTAAEERIASHEQRKQDALAQASQQRREAEDREQTRVLDLRQAASDRHMEHTTDLQRIDARATARRAELTTQATRLANTIDGLTADVTRCETDRAETQDASTQAAEQSSRLALRRREWDETTATLARLTSQRDELQRRLEEFLARQGEIAAMQQQLGALHSDLIEWNVLSKALGREGLQTIEIDDAGPAVSTYANGLLESSYGPRFSLDLVTQEAKQSKGKDGSTMKDVFEVKVFDARDGGNARDLSDLSGGEKVIVEEALRSAIALVVNTRNAHPIRTCFRDETTGALNAENAMRYMSMLRRVHELGGFCHTLFVTHNPDAAQLADAQILFSGGRAEIHLPPYASVWECDRDGKLVTSASVATANPT